MSPIFARTLTSTERKELSRLIRGSGDARVMRRAQMIRLSADGKTAGEIAALWDVTDQSIRRTIRRFNAEGIAGLADRPRKGRLSKKTDRYVALLEAALHEAFEELQQHPETALSLAYKTGTNLRKTA